MWTALQKYREQFDPMPSPATVKSWVAAGTLECWQPGGRGGTFYVRPVIAQNDTGQIQQSMRNALVKTKKAGGRGVA